MRDFGLDAFKRTKLGTRIGAVITDPANIAKMITLSEHGIPAVQAIGKLLLPLGDAVKAEENKQHVGRWVREILEEKGLTKTGMRRVAPGNLYSTGSIFAYRK